MQDWTTAVPNTDEEAHEALRYGKSSEVGDALVGIFDCRRLQGNDLLTAYEVALLALLSIDIETAYVTGDDAAAAVHGWNFPPLNWKVRQRPEREETEGR